MKTKTYRSPIEIKADGQPGEFRAVFATFNVIDKDGDVTLPGAFKDGAAVRISYWGHRWQDLPVGKGVIHQDDKKAWGWRAFHFAVAFRLSLAAWTFWQFGQRFVAGLRGIGKPILQSRHLAGL